MTPQMRLMAGGCAIALILIGVFLFLLWVAEAELDHRQQWIGGVQVDEYRVVARPGLAIAALWPTLIGLVIGLDWLLTATLRRTSGSTAGLQEGRYRLIAALQALVLVVLMVPGTFITLVGASQLVYAPEMQKGVARFEQGRPAREARNSYTQLIKQLEASEPAVRAQAAASIGELKVVLSQNAVPALTGLLGDVDDVAIAAAKTLGKIGIYSRSAVPELEKLLERGSMGRRRGQANEPDPMRVCAAEALARITPSGPWALQSALKHGNPEVRRCAAYALGLIDEKSNRHTAAGHLRATLKDEEDEHVRAAIRGALDKIDPQEPLSDVIRKLDDPDSAVRLGAAIKITQRGEEAKAAAPKLAELINDPDPEVRVAAAQALLRADPQSPLKFDALLLLLRSRQDYHRRHAAELLGKMGTEAERALPELRATMNDHDQHVRVRAAAAVWKISHESGDVIPVLVQLLEMEDASDGAQIGALNVLGDIGPGAQAAIPVVKAICDHGRPWVRPYAKSALRRIEGNSGGGEIRGQTTHFGLLNLLIPDSYYCYESEARVGAPG
ncbi:MAG TPA: HEAT repeat domain-containing protein [Candidatus Bathyarchaeia archaeon]|nr:HEAT repeat domain-containing protein [Candidatus Bathyarchaeia archaeon]